MKFTPVFLREHAPLSFGHAPTRARRARAPEPFARVHVEAKRTKSSSTPTSAAMADDDAVFGARKQISRASRRGANRTIPIGMVRSCQFRCLYATNISWSQNPRRYSNFGAAAVEKLRNHRFGNRGAGNGATIAKLRPPLAIVALLGRVNSLGLINNFDRGGVGLMPTP